MCRVLLSFVEPQILKLANCKRTAFFQASSYKADGNDGVLNALMSDDAVLYLIILT